MGQTAEVKEIDGGRSVEMEVTSDLVFLEVGGHCYVFDKAIMLHAVKKAFNIAIILERDVEGDFALP